MGIVSTFYNGVVELRLDWPATRNALGPDEGRVLLDAVTQAIDDGARAIVLAANGKAFCAGGKLDALLRIVEAGGPDAVRDVIYSVFQQLARTLATAPVPIIAAVEGPAIGFGCDLALAVDATFAGPGGWFAQGWARAGLIPATGGIFHATRRIGRTGLWRLAAADRIGQAEAADIGLAIAAEDARAAALEMAGRLAALPPAVVAAMKQLANTDEFLAHLSRAIDYQVGFFTDPAFPDRARALLGKG